MKCPNCGHVDLRGAPALKAVYEAIKEQDRFYPLFRVSKIAFCTEKSIRNTRLAIERLCKEGLVKVVQRKKDGNIYRLTT